MRQLNSTQKRGGDFTASFRYKGFVPRDLTFSLFENYIHVMYILQAIHDMVHKLYYRAVCMYVVEFLGILTK